MMCRTSCLYARSTSLAIPALSDRPFRDKAEDAIVLFNLLINDVRQQSHIVFTFIVRRPALLTHIPAVHHACPPFCSSPEPMPVQVPWATWGIAETRWFKGGSDWITTAGQRTVTMEGGAPMPIIVRDFNPYAVCAARTLAAASGQSEQGNWKKQLPNGNQMFLKVEDSVIAAGSIFKEDLRTSLPYVETDTGRISLRCCSD
jgi:hypothetical protein